jgi:hypothetical protein
MMQPALIGGVVIGVTSAMPLLNLLNCACCALVIGGGLLSAFLYFKDQPPRPDVPYGDAALLGLMSGAVGAVVGTLLSIPIQLAMSAIGLNQMAQLEELMRNQDLPPGVAGLLGGLVGGGISIVALLISLFFSLVVYSIFAMIGSMIGAAVFAKKA